MPKTTGDIFTEECSECGATFKGFTEKQAKAQLSSHQQTHEEEEI